jgi:hypothetical protein
MLGQHLSQACIGRDEKTDPGRDRFSMTRFLNDTVASDAAAIYGRGNRVPPHTS